MNYSDGVTSAIQTQINTKAPTASPTFTGTVAVPGYANLETTLDNNATSISNNYAAISTLSAINLNNLTTASVTDSQDKRYVTDAQEAKIDATSGTNTGDQTNITGNAGTATILATARTIGGVSFNGSANINLPGVNAAGNQATTGAAGSITGVTSSNAELNILDGVTSTAAELNILDGVTSTATELNILDGVTSTAAELNILDGVTATATELNYSDGVTSAIQTQIDGKLATNGTAATATILATARTIGGVSFNGSANITLPGVNAEGNQNTTGNAATATVATRVTNTNPPSATTDAGTAGEIRYDSFYVYICIATNTWRRAQLGAW